MAADLDYEIVADIVDSVDDLAVALVDDKVDYNFDEEVLVVVDFDVFHLQAEHQQPGEGEPYHLIIKMVWHIYHCPSFNSASLAYSRQSIYILLA